MPARIAHFTRHIALVNHCNQTLSSKNVDSVQQAGELECLIHEYVLLNAQRHSLHWGTISNLKQGRVGVASSSSIRPGNGLHTFPIE